MNIYLFNQIIFIKLYQIDLMAEVTTQSLGANVMAMLNDGRLKDDIKAELIAQGHDEQFVHELVAETAKLRYARRRTQGLALILGGALVCLVSCLTTIASSQAQEHLSTMLYGLTSLGILVVFAGLTRVF